MPVKLLDVRLALVDKIELRGDILQIVPPLVRLLRLGVVLESQIPQRDLVVGATDGD